MEICGLLDILQEKTQESLRMPKIPAQFLSLSFIKDTEMKKNKLFPAKNVFTIAASDIVDVDVVSCKRLTAVDDTVKKTLHLSLRFQKNQMVAYEPGDAFAIICPSSSAEVDTLINRLDLREVSDIQCEFVTQNGKVLPSYIPPISSLKYIFTNCVDIRSIPKKVLLRVLASYAEEKRELKILEYLSSHEGSASYNELIRKFSLSILDILTIFKSCKVPAERLLEHLPPLKPRYYSVANSPLACSKTFDIVFSVIDIESQLDGVTSRKGLCTGWLEEITQQLCNDEKASADNNVAMQFSRLSLNNLVKHTELPKISVFKRRNMFFRLPSDSRTPLIMVGPGTGVAPFIGFLQHRELEKIKSNIKEDFGETWLFYGCRHKNKDFLFRSELKRLEAAGILSHLVVCFSRVNEGIPQQRHVQDNIRLHAESINIAVDSGAVIFVCGDAAGMTKNVRDAFESVFQMCKGLSPEDARSYMKKLEEEKRYLCDIWT